ncbi:MAG TPA: ATP-binding protein [Burkholderiaceae bacterium]|nr:ATP-binding protein [Burkholderiaceae bacterium]
MQSFSLRTRLALLALAIVLPAAATGGLALSAAYEREQRALEETLRETTRALALVVDRELSLRETVARTLGAAPSIAQADLSEFGEQARKAMEDGTGWVVVTEHPGPGLPRRQVLNTSGGTGPVPNAGRDRAQFDAWTNDAPVVSDIFRGPVTGDWVVSVTAPSPHLRDGARVGVSVATNPATLQRVLTQQGLPANWTAAVVDRSGTVVARQPNPQRWVGERASPIVLERARSGDDAIFGSTSLDGEPVLSYVSRSPKYGWSFIIGVPQAQHRADLLASLRWVATWIGLVVAAAIALAVVVGRRIAAHVEQLGNAARLLETGQAEPFTPTGVTELDDVGRALMHGTERVRDANRRLEREVAEAVAAAQAAQLQSFSSQRLEALGRLTGGVAHDVNNLLGIISNHAFVLDRLHLEGRGATAVQAIRRAVESGRTLTQKLLAFAGRRSSNPTVVDLGTWMPEAVALARSTLPRGVTVELSIAADAPRVRIDATELEIALLNILVNANDAMPDGGSIRIEAGRLRMAESPLGVPSTYIDVADSGTGMPPELVDRVFEPFFTTKDVSKGTGLGLSQVYGLCRSAGGTVGIVSAPGRGTTVRMVLPATDQAVAAPPVAERATESTLPVRARLLYVEDNEELARATLTALQAYGYGVEWVEGATAARASLAASRFDLVLSDIVTPERENGLQLAQWLRAARPGLPVVLMTGYSEVSAQARASGFTVLQKPCAPEALHEVVRRHLDRGALRAAG